MIGHHRATLVTVFACCIAAFSWVPAHGLQLYDVDFSSPPHSVGSIPAVGSGAFPRDTPTAINFGDPVVVAQYGQLTQQPLHFDDGNFGYEQIEFALGNHELRYLVEFDLLIQPMPFDTATFSVLLDAPLINRITFQGDGSISLLQANDTGPNDVIGSFPFDQSMQVSIDVDLPSLTWFIEIDEALLHEGPFSSLDGDIATLRISAFFGNGSTPMGTAAIDNVIISSLEPIPEPSTFLLLSLGLASLTTNKRRGRRPASR